MNVCSIYKITNKINGKLYIGQTWETLQNRFIGHCKQNSHCIKLIRAIKKYGKSNFNIKLLIPVHTQECADYWEKYFIAKYNGVKNGYNLREGGNNGKLSNETKNKMRKPKSEKHKTNISNGRRGIKFSQTHKLNLSKANSGERAVKAKFTQNAVNIIRNEFATTKISITELARKYNVSFNTIKCIVNNKTYKVSHV